MTTVGLGAAILPAARALDINRARTITIQITNHGSDLIVTPFSGHRASPFSQFRALLREYAILTAKPSRSYIYLL